MMYKYYMQGESSTEYEKLINMVMTDKSYALIHLKTKAQEFSLGFDDEDVGVDREVFLHAEVIRYGIRMNRITPVDLISQFIETIQ